MPQEKREETGEKWITLPGGKKVLIKPGEDIEQKINEAKRDLRGEKGKNTKEARKADYPWGECTSDQEKDGKSEESADKICGSIRAKYGTKKSYIQREGLFKSEFNIRDRVTYKQYEKSGTVVGIMGELIKIAEDPNQKIVVVPTDTVFKTEELLKGGVHWDTLDPLDRIEYLDKCHLSPTYINKNWMEITKEIRTAIKTANPAGDSYGSNGETVNVLYNPLERSKTVSDRINEQLEQGDSEDEDDEKAN